MQREAARLVRLAHHDYLMRVQLQHWHSVAAGKWYQPDAPVEAVSVCEAPAPCRVAVSESSSRAWTLLFLGRGAESFLFLPNGICTARAHKHE